MMKHTIPHATSTLLLLLASLLSLPSCHADRQVQPPIEGDTLRLRHAHGLTIVRYSEYTICTLRNPWDTTQTLHRYILVQRDQPLPSSLPEGDIVRIPLQRAAVYTSVHCGLLGELGATQAIAGVCDLQYIHSPYIQSAVAQGTITDLGSSMQPNIERIMRLQPDALMPSPYENTGYGRLERMHIPIIECADYMEDSPLGRAEWMLFYGILFGQEQRADSLFRAIEHTYCQLARQAKQAHSRPIVMADLPYEGTWYMPRNESTMGRLFSDASARYLFADIPGSGSQPMTIESVMQRASQAHIWLIRYNQDTPMTRLQMSRDYPYSRRIQAQTYGCNTAHSDFYEETPFHPEWLLADLVQIFHPELPVLAEKSYFCPIE